VSLSYGFIAAEKGGLSAMPYRTWRQGHAEQGGDQVD
jgi:hypothetical protein